MVNDLVERGYVAREPNPADRRSHLLVTTGEGDRVSRLGMQATEGVRARLKPHLAWPIDELDPRFEELIEALRGALRSDQPSAVPRYRRRGETDLRAGRRRPQPRARSLVLAEPGHAAVTGEQRILLVSVTWGPEHYAAGEGASALAEAARFVRSASFGQTWIVGDATPWLRALPGPPAQCALPQIERLAREAAVRAGYDLSRYTRLAFSFPRVEACPWGGAYFGDSVWANGYMSWELIAHELGHLYGVPEEGPAWVCDGGRCEARNYESPYSVMGHGSSDFNAYEKAVYGWLTNVTQVERAGELVLAAIDRPSGEPQAVHVLAGGDEYWLEYRPPLPLWPPFQPDAPPGVVVYGGDNGIDDAPSRFTQRNLQVADPAGLGRPSLGLGERFGVAGGFEVAVEAADAERAVLRFRWTDSTPLGAPRILQPAPTARGRRVIVRWRPALDRGSGVAAHEIVLDGRRARRILAVRSLGTLLVPTEPELVLGRLAPGAHRVAVRAVDRAGNRGRAAVRRFRVPR